MAGIGELTRPVIVSFGQRVREMRRTAGLTQDDLARLSRMTVRYIIEIEQATSNPSLGTIALLAVALECEVADFFPRDQRLQ
jgi:transcriptional regulator with XRE-family HTH domain